jgi:hypothetical protein
MPKINQVYLYKLGEHLHPSYTLFNFVFIWMYIYE